MNTLDMPLDIQLPLTDEAVSRLRAGMTVRLNGPCYTARDAAHKRLTEMLARGESAPFALENAVIYYCGPCPAPPGRPIGSAGPTSSLRMDSYAPELIRRYHLRSMIGKGNRSRAVVEAIREAGGVYFAATGGAGALIARSVVSCETAAFADLGPEAIYRLEVRDLPLIVAIDAHGGNLYEERPVRRP